VRHGTRTSHFCKLLAGNDYTITVRPKLLERIANGQTMMTVELKFQKLNGAPIGAEVNAIVDRIRIGLRYNPMA
jgi:hypothetical protein